MLVPELIAERSPLVKRAWLWLFERRTFADAAGIHVTSRREEDDARRTGIPLPHPLLVPNGIDLARFRPEARNEHRAAVRAKLGLSMPAKAIEDAFDQFRDRGLMFLDGNLALSLALPATRGR